MLTIKTDAMVMPTRVTVFKVLKTKHFLIQKLKSLQFTMFLQFNGFTWSDLQVKVNFWVMLKVLALPYILEELHD